VEVLVVRDSSRAVAVRRDNGLSASVCVEGSKAIGVVTLVCEQVFVGKTVDQAFCLVDIGDLAGREDEADRVAESVDNNAELRAQTAARTPDRLIFGPPFGLAAGDVATLGEPLLALTLPKQPTELDDGLLTASEVWRSSGSMPTGWCCRPATLRPTTSPARKRCRASCGPSSMSERERFSSRAGQSMRRR
jgi:hypothetical protein